MSKVAMCRNCPDTPLVCTLAFSQHEFVCVRCGRLYDWLGPAAADETPELLARIKELEAEWEPIGSALIARGAYHRDCAECASRKSEHFAHATAAELAAHEQALAAFRALGSAAA